MPSGVWGDPALATKAPTTPHPPTHLGPLHTHPPTWALYMPFAYLAFGRAGLNGPVSFSFKKFI